MQSFKQVFLRTTSQVEISQKESNPAYHMVSTASKIGVLISSHVIKHYGCLTAKHNMAIIGSRWGLEGFDLAELDWLEG